MLSKNKIKYINSLRIKKFRTENAAFIAEGEKLAKEIFYSDFEITDLIGTKKWLTKNENLTEKIEPTKIIPATEKELKKISEFRTPSEIIVIVKIPEKKINNQTLTSKIQQQLCLFLETIQDPGNMGTIIRTADWFGIKNIVCSQDCVDAFNPKVVQASMGAITRITIYQIDKIDFFTNYRQTNLSVYGTFLDGQNIYTHKLSKTGLIVIGNEGQGISAEITPFISEKIHIPPYSTNQTESLNASIATGIVLSEFRRKLI